MTRVRLIILTSLLFSLTGCFTFNNGCPEICVPEIAELDSSPEIHTALLTSSLKENVIGDFKCGFYFGKDKRHMNKSYADISGKEFKTVVQGLEEGTLYWYCAFVSNGVNESCSGYKYFTTEKEPVEPEEPPVEPDPGPEEPPVEPEPGPEEPPVDPEPVFDVEILALQAEVSGDMVELMANLRGSTTLVKEGLFYVGDSEDNLDLKVKGTLAGETLSAILTNLSPGIHWFRTEVSDGKTVVKSALQSFEIESPVEPDPGPEEPPVEPEPVFDVEILALQAEVAEDMVEFVAQLSGNTDLVKDCCFYLGESEDNLSLKIEGNIDGQRLFGLVTLPPPGTYWFRAEVGDGKTVVSSEMKSFEVKSQVKPDPEIKPEFTVSVGKMRAEIEGSILYLSAVASGDVRLIEKNEFWLEDDQGRVLKLQAGRDGNLLSAFIAGLSSGVYKAYAVVSNGSVIKKSEVVTVVI